MLNIVVPVAFQQLITAGLNMIDVLMVGQLGKQPLLRWVWQSKSAFY